MKRVLLLALIVILPSISYSQEKLFLVKRKNPEKRMMLNPKKSVKIRAHGKKYKFEQYSIIGKDKLLIGSDTISLSDISEFKAYPQTNRWRKIFGYPLLTFGVGITGLGTALFVSISSAILPVAVLPVAVVMIGLPSTAIGGGLELLGVSRVAYDLTKWKIVAE